jgi:transposase-like protein
VTPIDLVSMLVSDELLRRQDRLLERRHKLARPVLAVIDGNPGLSSARRSHWPGIVIQRCTAHKLRNLQAKAPARLREALTEDYRRMIYADTVSAVEQERGRFTKKWQLRCPAVVESLKEAGDDLFTFLRFPPSQWKPCAPRMRSSGSTRNSVDARRRRPVCQDRTRSSCCSSVCCAVDQVKLRALVGYQDLGQVKKVA